MKKFVSLILIMLSICMAQPFLIKDSGWIRTPSTNAGVGYGTLFYNLTGVRNSCFGEWAGASIDNDTDNTMIGYQAGFAVNSNFGTFVGSYAGYYASTGANNTFVGYEAGRGNATNTGNANTFIGYQSGKLITTGTTNVAMGFTAGAKLSTGAYNTYLGSSAGSAVTTGICNTIIGANSGSPTLTTGGQNVFIGYNAGNGYTTESGQFELRADYYANVRKLLTGNFADSSLTATGDVTIDGKLTMTVPDWKIHRNDSIALTSADVWQTIQFDTMIVAESTLGFHFNADSSKVVFEYPGIFAILGCVHTKWRGGNTQESIFIRGRINSVEKRCLQRSHTHEKQTNDANDFNIVGTVAVDTGDSLDIQIQVTDTDYKIMGNYDIFDFPVALSLNISYITEKP